MRKKKPASIQYGYVVQRNIGHDRSVIVYLNNRAPWHQGALAQASVWPTRESAARTAWWWSAQVCGVVITNGRIELIHERNYLAPIWTGDNRPDDSKAVGLGR